MKAGIIGTGAVAGHHARAIAQMDGIELAAVTSRTREKAEQMAARYGAKCYPDAASLLDDHSIELVIICTFPDSHCEYAVAAARKGKHVLVEKPLDLSLERARQTIEECRKELISVIEGWVPLRLRMGRSIPPVGGITEISSCPFPIPIEEKSA